MRGYPALSRLPSPGRGDRSMPPVAAAQRSPVFLPHPDPVEHGRPFGLLRWLDAAWFPWVWMALWAAMQVGHALVSWHFVATGAALLRSDGSGAGLNLYAAHPQLQMAIHTQGNHAASNHRNRPKGCRCSTGPGCGKKMGDRWAAATGGMGLSPRPGRRTEGAAQRRRSGCP